MSRCDDYCCNNGCNQGRYCPARVAPVGARMPKNPQPLRVDWSRTPGIHRLVLVVIGALYLVALAAMIYA